jgi:hypothetical protein
MGSIVTLILEGDLKAQLQESALEQISREPGQMLWLSFEASKAHVISD